MANQMEKTQQDKNLRARLQKEKMDEQAWFVKWEDMFNMALRSMKPLPVIRNSIGSGRACLLSSTSCGHSLAHLVQTCSNHQG
jgi:hypothetical protein